MRCLVAMHASLLVVVVVAVESCRAQPESQSSSADASALLHGDRPHVTDRPVPNTRVRRFLDQREGDRENAFDELSFEDALDAAAMGLLWHPQQRTWFKWCLARFGKDVVHGLAQRAGRVEPNSDIEVTLDLLERAVDEFPGVLSETDLRIVQAAAQRLEGRLAREWAEKALAHLRERMERPR